MVFTGVSRRIGDWMVDHFPRVYLFWDQNVSYHFMNALVRAQRAWLSRGGRCYPKVGVRLRRAVLRFARA